ncbi:hypothetical protein NG791_01710 [Laspinema sp. D1]|uniref:hypothetical protein n=1 Tax=Laspinema palackyanum TaxID=3231601 RepID=UPI00347E2266|nr:hypothetical protein [Laspinema sp. D2b]
MLKHQVCNSDTRQSKLLADSQLLGLGLASGHEWSPMIQDNCLKTLDCPVQPSKKSHLPSNFSLFLAWIFLLMTVAALLAPIATSWSSDFFNNPIGSEGSGLALPE